MPVILSPDGLKAASTGRSGRSGRSGRVRRTSQAECHGFESRHLLSEGSPNGLPFFVVLSENGSCWSHLSGPAGRQEWRRSPGPCRAHRGRSGDGHPHQAHRRPTEVGMPECRAHPGPKGGREMADIVVAALSGWSRAVHECMIAAADQTAEGPGRSAAPGGPRRRAVRLRPRASPARRLRTRGRWPVPGHASIVRAMVGQR